MPTGENREEYITKCEGKEEGSKLIGSYSSDVLFLVNFLFQVNSKIAFQVNFWLMGLYLSARLQTSLDLREACRFTANKVTPRQGNPEFSSFDVKNGDLSYCFTRQHISEG